VRGKEEIEKVCDRLTTCVRTQYSIPPLEWPVPFLVVVHLPVVEYDHRPEERRHEEETAGAFRDFTRPTGEGADDREEETKWEGEHVARRDVTDGAVAVRESLCVLVGLFWG